MAKAGIITKATSAILGALAIAGLAALGSSAAITSCAGNADKDADGFFGESSLCGGPLFDCNEDDRSVGNGRLYYCDSDNDGYGDPTRTVYLCDDVECDAPPCPGVTNGLDCDDNNIDPTLIGLRVYPDCDGDKLGDPSRMQLFCASNNDAVPDKDYNDCAYVLNADDCNDKDAAQNLQTEVWLDCDGDAFGDEIVGPFRVCSNAFNLSDLDPAKDNESVYRCPFATQGGDCKDEDPDVNPEENPEGNTCPDDAEEEQ